MLTDQVQQTRLAEIEQAISRRIVERTAGQIRSLEVEVRGNEVLIRGIASSYYQKQLALKGALEVIGSAVNRQIACEIEVLRKPSASSARSRGTRGRRRRT